MKKLLFILGTAMVRNWLSPPLSPQSLQSSEPEGTYRLNTDYIQELSKKYAGIIFAGLLFSLFFVAGFSILIFSAAQSVDLTGTFVAGAVFYSGLCMVAVSALVLLYCWRSAARNAPDFGRFYLYEPKQDPGLPAPRLSDYAQLAKPILSTLVSAWSSRRRPNPYPSASTPKGGEVTPIRPRAI